MSTFFVTKWITYIGCLLMLCFPVNALCQHQAWKFESQRPELAPRYWTDSTLLFETQPTLVLAGNGKSYVNGMWTTSVPVHPQSHYQFTVHYKSSHVEEATRCILAKIIWLDTSGKQIGRAEYPAIEKNDQLTQWTTITQLYQIPDQAITAKIELIYRWDADGIVHFGGGSLKEAAEVKSRNVRLATIQHQPKGSSGPDQNREEFADLIRVAAEKGADIVCLPEGITLVGTKQNYLQASEPIPGPSTDFFGKLARELEMYIVAGILEKSGEVIYNTAILLDRNGNLAGKYRKVCLPREEIEGGVTPGESLPVFETDFGTIGMMICWDVTFPEVSRTLAQKGAEVIFLPIWGGNLTLTQARAIENQVYIVSSSYNMKTGIFDLEGDLIQEASEENKVIVADIDLNHQKLWPWLGDLKNRIPKEMPTKKAVQMN